MPYKPRIPFNGRKNGDPGIFWKLTSRGTSKAEATNCLRSLVIELRNRYSPFNSDAGYTADEVQVTPSSLENWINLGVYQNQRQIGVVGIKYVEVDTDTSTFERLPAHKFAVLFRFREDSKQHRDYFLNP